MENGDRDNGKWNENEKMGTGTINLQGNVS
jgi:hypothetical protein